MKNKPHKSVSKRLKITKQGKILRRKLSSQHLVKNKSQRTKAQAGKPAQLVLSDQKKYKNLL